LGSGRLLLPVTAQLEALAAEDRPAVARGEWHLRRAAARRAYGGIGKAGTAFASAAFAAAKRRATKNAAPVIGIGGHIQGLDGSQRFRVSLGSAFGPAVRTSLRATAASLGIEGLLGGGKQKRLLTINAD